MSATTLTLSIITTFPNQVVSFHHRLLVSVVLWLLFIILLIGAVLASRKVLTDNVRFVQIKENRPTNAGRPPRTEQPASEAEVRLAIQDFSERFQDGNIVQLASIITDPAKYFLRIHETGTFEDNEAISTTVRTIHSTTDGNFLVPILRPTKGELIDGVSVVIDGKSISTLTHNEMLGALSLVVSSVFFSAFPDNHDDPVYVKALWTVLTSIGGRTQIGQWDKEHLDSAIDELKWSSNDKELEKLRKALRLLIRQLENEYIVIAVVQNCKIGDRLKVRVSDCKMKVDTDRKRKNRIRRNLGLQPRTYRFRMPQAAETRSFHFETECPLNTYFSAAGIVGLVTDTDGDPQLETKLSTLIQHTRIEGQRTAHLYIHDFSSLTARLPESENLRLMLQTDFRERPPGVIGIQIWMSLYLSALTWLAGYDYNNIFGKSQAATSHGIDFVWSALFFGVPVLVAPWVTSKIIMERLSIISSASYALLIWFVINSTLTTFLAGIIFVSGAKWSFTIADFVHIRHGTWTLLMISVGVQLSVSAMYLISKTRSYNELFGVSQGDRS